ncbi:hypothetical protein LCGC14_1831110 [marine sediment metagenome]|uniref:Carbohydrate-binding domain-containing protein n=1 Tax=marine sediment metagenome TaxID=412755 RepID=A0A0F9GG50_9ZZZZ
MTKTISVTILIWVLVCGAAGSAGASEAEVKAARQRFGPPVMWVAKPAAPPVIDGKLDDAVWAKAQAVELGSLMDGWDTPSQRTVARVLADEKAIYFAVKCFEAEPDRVVAAGDKRDGALWNGDTVELFLDPGHTSRRLNYFHVIINPKGLVYDGKGKKPGAWNAAIVAKAGTFKGGWTVEASVPMKDLGVVGAIPKVWGLNVNRQRLELGRPTRNYPLTPSLIKIPSPEKYRIGEDTAWSPTYCESSHIVQRFGHAVLAAGTVNVPAPKKLLAIIYKSDFDDGKAPGWSGAKVVAENFRGPGKCIAPTGGSGAIHFARPLADMDDVTIIYALKMPNNGRFSYYGRAPDNEQCEADRHEVLITSPAAKARKWPAMDEWHTHASKMAWRPMGKLWTGPGPWDMMTGHFSEPSIGNVMHPGTDWVVVRTRLGMLRRQRSQGLVPAAQNYPRGFTFAAGGAYFMDQVVIFRGADVEGPERVGGVAVGKAGDAIAVSWKRAADNTMTIYYDVLADGKVVAQSHRLSARVVAEKLKGKKITVVAVDMYGNRSKPSRAVKGP